MAGAGPACAPHKRGQAAGGPHSLVRFATGRSLTTKTPAAGGNAPLLTLGV